MKRIGRAVLVEVVVMARRTLLTALTLIDDTAGNCVSVSGVRVAIAATQITVAILRQAESRVDFSSLVVLVCIAVLGLFAVQSGGAAAEVAVYAADVLAGAGAVLLLLYALFMSRSSIASALVVASACCSCALPMTRS